MTVYVIQGFSGGMGNELHLHAAVLAQAMGQEGAIFAWGKDACKSYHVHCRDLLVYLLEHSCTEAEIGHMRKINVTDRPPNLRAP